MGFLKRLFSTEKFNSSKDSTKSRSRRQSSQLQLNDDLTLIRDFCACVNGEMNLLSGQKARFLYEEDDWFYVESRRGDRGYVPRSYFRGQVRQGVTRLSSYNSNHERDFMFESDDSLEHFCEDEAISEDEIDDLFVTANSTLGHTPSAHAPSGHAPSGHTPPNDESLDNQIMFQPLKEAYLPESEVCHPTMTSTPKKLPLSRDPHLAPKRSNFASLVDLHILLHDESQILYFV